MFTSLGLAPDGTEMDSILKNMGDLAIKQDSSDKDTVAASSSGGSETATSSKESNGQESDKKEEKPVPKYRQGLSREDLIGLLTAMDGHKPVARQISRLAHKMVGELPKEEEEKETAKTRALKRAGKSQQSMMELYKPEVDFVTAAKRISELNLPEDPFEKYGLSEQRFQDVLGRFQHDREVMMLAERILPQMHAPQPPTEEEQAEEASGEPVPRKELSLSEVCKVHEAMIAILSQVLRQFQELPREVRRPDASWLRNLDQEESLYEESQSRSELMM